MSQGPGSTSPASPAAFVCVSCGYNLQATNLNSTCPECGKPVSDSISGDVIEHADPAWAMDMARALTWLIYYVIGILVYSALLFIGAIALAAIKFSALKAGTQPSAIQTPADVVFQVLNMLASIIMMACFLIICERLTRKEPGREQTPRPYESWRTGTRICLPVSVFFTLIGVAIQVFQLFNPPANPMQMSGLALASMGLGLLGMLPWGVLMYCTVLIPADLAKRIQSQPLERQARRIIYYFYGFWGSMILMGISTFISFTVVAITGKPELMMINCFACLFGPVILCVAIASLIETFMCYPKVAAAIRERVQAAHPGV